LSDAGAVYQVGQTAVGDLHLAVGGEHDVAAVDVAVNDSFAVRRPQALRRLDDDIQRVLGLQGPIANTLGQLPAVNVRHRQKGTALGFAKLVDRANVRMIERSGSLGLAQKSLGLAIGGMKLQRTSRHAIIVRTCAQPNC